MIDGSQREDDAMVMPKPEQRGDVNDDVKEGPEVGVIWLGMDRFGCLSGRLLCG